MKLKEQVANFFTLLNLVCGVAGIMFLSYDYLYIACLFVFLGAVFDFFDGFIARALKISSDLGKQLDSLCDMVTFGVLPGLIAQTLLRQTLKTELDMPANLEFVAILIPVFSAYRLAKFNIDSRQSADFIGMPTPANAIFWSSLGMCELAFTILPGTQGLSSLVKDFFIQLTSDKNFLLAGILATSFLMVSPLRLFGFKFKKFQWAGNEMKLLLAAIAVILFLIFSITAIPIIILLYILFSIVHFYILKRDETNRLL